MKSSTLQISDPKDWLSLDAFASAAGWPVNQVLAAVRDGAIARRRLSRPNRHGHYWIWGYFVGDLPEDCGSPLLLNYLLRRAQRAHAAAHAAQQKIDRVVAHQRQRRAA